MTTSVEKLHKTTDTKSSYQDIVKCLGNRVQKLDFAISDSLSSDVPLATEVARYITCTGGKKLRPILTLLSYQLLDQTKSESDQDITAAVVIELIHTATLLHDDVVDESEVRRGQKAAAVEYGNAASVLVGDFLYSRAFQLMTRLENYEVMRLFSNTTNAIAEGEVLQLSNRFDADLSHENYIKTIEQKTAQLFAAATETGALLTNASKETIQHCRAFGLSLGVAFQIWDDALDYAGENTEIGKNLGDDLIEGKVTLPLLYLREKATADEWAIVKAAIESPESANLQAIQSLIHQYNAIQYCKEMAQKYSNEAKQHLANISEHLCATTLEKLYDLADLTWQRAA